MDGLTQDERALAWLASWHPSFDGKAIINEDFTFRAVNPQFCALLKVTPAELIGNRFTDITPQPIRDLDIKNANLVKRGIITDYILPKSYEMNDGRKVTVTLLVNGVYHGETKEFLFFAVSIMERNETTAFPPTSHKQQFTVPAEDKRKVIWGLLAILGAAMAAASEKFIKLIMEVLK